MAIKPNLIITSIFAKLFFKPLIGGTQYIAPGFMYESMSWWQNCPPKLIYGGKKIVCSIPPDCDAFIEIQSKPLTMNEMFSSLTVIPISELRKVKEAFLWAWMMVEQLGYSNMQAGISISEFEHLQNAFGPGSWEQEIRINHET